jgi:tetratricopeptide (TPR) repeat protein
MDTDARFKQLMADGHPAGVAAFLVASDEAASGNMEAAEAAFAQAVLLAPAFHLARYQLGLLQFSSGRASVAQVTWQPLLELAQADPLPHYVRGFAALARDDFAQSLAHYRAGLECDNTNPAVAADVMKVVEQVQRVLAAAEAPAESTEQESSGSHVLLQGYLHGLH